MVELEIEEIKRTSEGLKDKLVGQVKCLSNLEFFNNLCVAEDLEHADQLSSDEEATGELSDEKDDDFDLDLEEKSLSEENGKEHLPDLDGIEDTQDDEQLVSDGHFSDETKNVSSDQGTQEKTRLTIPTCVVKENPSLSSHQDTREGDDPHLVSDHVTREGEKSDLSSDLVMSEGEKPDIKDACNVYSMQKGEYTVTNSLV
ncbi:hypothetical protein L2E82_39779 [Cichorium intybus]|uniref:Uncharacterized protein n=1 Tax=Cichorium intybus TaxID=13427 RepID=A0ACB9AKI1_CICIN|nr:hypothetical protein L2E82_39779 [Cichorium intybus]